MTILLILVCGVVTIIISKHYFNKWFNHVALYATIWTVMLSLYELRLIRYIELSSKTWLVIVSAFFLFILGVVTIFLARSIFDKNITIKTTPRLATSVFYKNGQVIKYTIIIFSIVGILSALQHWKVLFDEYGNLTNIIIEAFKIYRERTEGDLEGVIPYVWLTSYIGVFFAGLYTAYKNRFTFIAILPIFGVLLKEIANFSRARILLSLMEFFISFILFRHYLSLQNLPRIRVSKVNIILTITIIFSILVLGASAVRFMRHPVEEMKGTSTSLESFKGGFIITPGIYLYASSHVAVLDRHLEEEARAKLIGSKTISPIYRFLGGFKLVEKPSYHQKGYFVPQWTNTGTYLRDIHSDFGYWGVFSIPYLLGLLSTFFWFRFYEKGHLTDYVVLTYLYLLISMSFLLWVSSFPSWMIVLFSLLAIIPLLEKFSLWRESNKRN